MRPLNVDVFGNWYKNIGNWAKIACGQIRAIIEE
jgi:hypothetical protein